MRGGVYTATSVRVFNKLIIIGVMMSFRLIIFLALFGFTSVSAWDIEKTFVNMDPALDGATISHENGLFFIEIDGEKKEIQKYSIDKEVRNLSTEQLKYILGKKKIIEFEGNQYVISTLTHKEFEQDLVEGQFCYLLDALSDEDKKNMKQILSPSGKLYVKQLGDNEYSIRFKHLLPGGAVGGWVIGAWAGKIISSAVCHGSIYLVSAAVSAVATPAVGTIVYASLETTLAPSIEAFTTAAALAGGIAGGVASGPV